MHCCPSHRAGPPPEATAPATATIVAVRRARVPAAEETTLSVAQACALIVVNHGSAALLEENLAVTTTGTDWAVVVVDNSADLPDREAARDVAQRHGWHLVPTHNDGFGAGVNRGLAAASSLGAEIAVVLNPDLRIDPADVEALAMTCHERPEVMVAPTIRRPDGQPWFVRGELDRRRGWTRSVSDGPGPVGWLSGACLAAPMDVWRRLGGFDGRYFMYWEDVDLGWRARRARIELVVRSDLVAIHAVGGTQSTAHSRRKSNLYYEQNCRNRLLFAALHLPPRERARWALHAPRYAYEVLLRGGRRQLLAGPGPVLAATRGTLRGAAGLFRPHPAWPPERGRIP